MLGVYVPVALRFLNPFRAVSGEFVELPRRSPGMVYVPVALQYWDTSLGSYG